MTAPVSSSLGTTDNVALFDSNYNQVLLNAIPMKSLTHPSSRIMEHPLETGQIISDYKIILPVEIVIPFIITAQYYRDTYAEITNLYNNSELLVVQTRVSIYSNMVITELPDEERPDMFDVITLELHMKQVLLVQAASNFSPADPTQVNTQNSGQQSATPTTLPSNSTTNNPKVVQTQFGASGSW